MEESTDFDFNSPMQDSTEIMHSPPKYNFSTMSDNELIDAQTQEDNPLLGKQIEQEMERRGMTQTTQPLGPLGQPQRKKQRRNSPENPQHKIQMLENLNEMISKNPNLDIRKLRTKASKIINKIETNQNVTENDTNFSQAEKSDTSPSMPDDNVLQNVISKFLKDNSHKQLSLPSVLKFLKKTFQQDFKDRKQDIQNIINQHYRNLRQEQAKSRTIADLPMDISRIGTDEEEDEIVEFSPEPADKQAKLPDMDDDDDDFDEAGTPLFVNAIVEGIIDYISQDYTEQWNSISNAQKKNYRR